MAEAGNEKKKRIATPPPVVLHGKYELGRVLGHGSFAKVVHARNLENGDSVAMKVVSKEKVEKVGMSEQIKREISVMKRVKHPNIVNLHEVMATKSKIYIAMEYVRGGELFAEVAAKGRLPDAAARWYFRQLISAVDFCHSRGVFHRDLKPENLLLDGATGGLKITDFGLSALSEHLRHDGLLHTACGTPAYAAPEVIGKRGYDGAKADLWSCGVVLFVLLAGFLPFHDDNIMLMYKKIHRGDFKFPPWISPETRRIVRKLLDPNPNTRITASQLMDTPWFKKQSNLDLETEQQKQSNLDLEKQSNLDLETEQKQSSLERCVERQTETLNAFHIISLSEGLDLSGLFEEGEAGERMRRFGTGTGERVVVAGLEEAARAGRLSVKRSVCSTRVRMEGKEMGRKGRLGIAAEMFQFSPAFMVVEVNKDGGDTLEYNHFCNSALRPALKDIVWTAAAATGNAGFELYS